MTRLTSFLGFALACALAGCAGDSSSDESSSGSGACQVGYEGCACLQGVTCHDDGVSCIEGACVACPKGTEGCGCRNETPPCEGDLTCQSTDPSCQLDCEAYCEMEA